MKRDRDADPYEEALTLERKRVVIRHPNKCYDEYAVVPLRWEASLSNPSDSPLDRAIRTARDACIELEAGLPVYAYETNAGGGRRFAAASHEQFLALYRRCTRRHYHEVIRGPVKLYADVDAELTGDDFDGHADMRRLIRDLAEYLREALRERGVESNGVVCLEACKGRKLSYHLIVDTGHARFATVQDAGRFMHYVALRSGDRFVWPTDPKAPGRTFVVDLGVYTRNHCFRLYGSSKQKAPDRPLHPCDAFHPAEAALPAGRIDADLFRAALITHVPADRPVLELLTCCWSSRVSDRAPASTFVSASAYTAGNGQGRAPRAISLPPDTQLELETLQELVKEQIVAEIPDAEHMLYFDDGAYHPESGVLVFYSRSKRCEIKRADPRRRGMPGEHASNHVYYVAWLRRKTFAQGCHNEECARASLERRFPTLATTPEAEEAQALRKQRALESTGRGYGDERVLYEGLWPAIDDFLAREAARAGIEIAVSDETLAPEQRS